VTPSRVVDITNVSGFGETCFLQVNAWGRGGGGNDTWGWEQGPRQWRPRPNSPQLNILSALGSEDMWQPCVMYTHTYDCCLVVRMYLMICQALHSKGQHTQSLQANGCCLCFCLFLIGTRHTGIVLDAIHSHLKQTSLVSQTHLVFRVQCSRIWCQAVW
jgi:hypothetical protein